MCAHERECPNVSGFVCGQGFVWLERHSKQRCRKTAKRVHLKSNGTINLTEIDKMQHSKSLLFFHKFVPDFGVVINWHRLLQSPITMILSL